MGARVNGERSIIPLHYCKEYLTAVKFATPLLLLMKY